MTQLKILVLLSNLICLWTNTSLLLLNLVFFNFIIFHRIRFSIFKTAAITLANAFVHSHLGYCNSLFYGFPKYSIHRLQKIQNKTAHI